MRWTPLLTSTIGAHSTFLILLLVTLIIHFLKKLSAWRIDMDAFPVIASVHCPSIARSSTKWPGSSPALVRRLPLFLEEYSGPVQGGLGRIKFQKLSMISDWQLAMEAGFDGVEIHGGDGYLIEQFMKDQVNDRSDDEYGGSLENRCRFALEIVEALANEIGADRVGIKLTPFEHLMECIDSKPELLAMYMANALNNRNIVYLHVTQGRRMLRWQTGSAPAISLLPMRIAFNNTFIVTGGFNKILGNRAMVENYADLVGYGRLFLANPDLPRRFQLDAPLNQCDYGSLCIHHPVRGYLDYPFLNV